MASIEEVIQGRRSIGKVKEDAVPKELLERIIEAATWAPNHFGSQPWKFVVMTGQGRRVLGQAYADVAAEKLGDLPEAELSDKLEKAVAQAFRAPAVIAAICSPSDDARAVAIEELAAAHAAVQNLLLSAHANGLGAVWRTGEPAYHPKMKSAFGLAEEEQIVGLIYVGYPDMAIPVGKRVPAAEKTVWLES